MQGTYIPQYTPVPPTAVPIEVSLSPSMKLEWRGSRTFVYYAFLHLLFERGLKFLYGVVAGSCQLFKLGVHISFSFCFLSFLFLLFSNPSFYFLKLFARALVLFCCTAGHGIKHQWLWLFFPHVLGREMGRDRKTNPAGRPRNQKRFQEEKIARGFDAVLSKHR